MSATTTSSAPEASCTGGISSWILPVNDAACGLINSGGNYSQIMDSCCADADVESFNDDCGIYCLAQGQSVGDLLSCIEDKGATPGDFFCSGNLTATATAPAPTQTGDNDNDDDDDDDNDNDSDDASPTSDDDDPEPTGAAARLSQPVSKTGLGVLAMLFASALFGVAV
ncbi:hypothetical protein BJY04DRAFT_223997 [Aspergillus karnatakaensis]|uniref:uncharacterized protein n=1 Tax=Aspergillus karnatakaensis TaxID=1810916 RepID=UPI003CCC8FAB